MKSEDLIQLPGTEFYFTIKEIGGGEVKFYFFHCHELGNFNKTTWILNKHKEPVLHCQRCGEELEINKLLLHIIGFSFDLQIRIMEEEIINAIVLKTLNIKSSKQQT